jgi:hypothetical protein
MLGVLGGIATRFAPFPLVRPQWRHFGDGFCMIARAQYQQQLQNAPVHSTNRTTMMPKTVNTNHGYSLHKGEIVQS